MKILITEEDIGTVFDFHKFKDSFDTLKEPVFEKTTVFPTMPEEKTSYNLEVKTRKKPGRKPKLLNQ